MERWREQVHSAAVAARISLGAAIDETGSRMLQSSCEQLHRAAARGVESLNRLVVALEGDLSGSTDLPLGAACPPIAVEDARILVDSITGIIADIEHFVLRPAEDAMEEDEALMIKRLVGQCWGWLVCDLQDPIWQAHPELAPNGDA